jgi:hypothetical protein
VLSRAPVLVARLCRESARAIVALFVPLCAHLCRDVRASARVRLCVRVARALQLLLGLGSKPADTTRIYFVTSMGYGLLMMLAGVLAIWLLSTSKCVRSGLRTLAAFCPVPVCVCVFACVCMAACACHRAHSGVLRATAYPERTCVRPYARLCVPTRFEFIVIAAASSTLVCYLISAFIHGAVFSLSVVLLQYVYMLPTYVNIFSVFSFCNLHDISWGTKEGKCRPFLHPWPGVPARAHGFACARTKATH